MVVICLKFEDPDEWEEPLAEAHIVEMIEEQEDGMPTAEFSRLISGLAGEICFVGAEGSTMGQGAHGSATTTHAVRAVIQRSQA